MNPGMVILIGLGVVFAGLILLIIAIYIMNGIIAMFGKKEQENMPAKQEAAPEADDMDHDELIAVIVAAIAAKTNTNAAGLRVVSLKRI